MVRKHRRRVRFAAPAGRGTLAATVRAFLGFVMYLGVAVSVLAFFLPSLGGRVAGVAIPPDVARLLPWVGLGMTLVGYFGRRILPRDDEVEWR